MSMHPPLVSLENLFQSGVEACREERFAEAETCFRAILRRDASLSPAHANLALALDRQGRPEEAETHYQSALALAPPEPRTLLNYGALLLDGKRFAEAEACYRRALALDENNPAGWSNLGMLLACTQRENEAEDCYRRAIAIEPQYVNAHFNLAYLLLRQGRYDEGWRHFEYRDWFARLGAWLGLPRWNGRAAKGKAVVIGLEAGHGDIIQFCRYARLLKEAGARKVGLLCPPALLRLLRAADGIDACIPCDRPFDRADWECWTPLLSLPGHFGTRLETIPARLPYIRPDPRAAAEWRRRLPKAGRLTIGLAWKGNPAFENDGDRSLPGLATLAPLAALPGIRLVSLQKGAGEDEARQSPPFPIACFAEHVRDFADTAALIAELDLVVSVDTAVAHLAGALGKPCWVLLPSYKTDWRWLTKRDDSPWYPGALRLFRQREAGNWPDTIRTLAAALGELAARLGD